MPQPLKYRMKSGPIIEACFFPEVDRVDHDEFERIGHAIQDWINARITDAGAGWEDECIQVDYTGRQASTYISPGRWVVIFADRVLDYTTQQFMARFELAPTQAAEQATWSEVRRRLWGDLTEGAMEDRVAYADVWAAHIESLQRRGAVRTLYRDESGHWYTVLESEAPALDDHCEHLAFEEEGEPPMPASARRCNPCTLRFTLVEDVEAPAAPASPEKAGGGGS